MVHERRGRGERVVPATRQMWGPRRLLDSNTVVHVIMLVPGVGVTKKGSLESLSLSSLLFYRSVWWTGLTGEPQAAKLAPQAASSSRLSFVVVVAATPSLELDLQR